MVVQKNLGLGGNILNGESKMKKEGKKKEKKKKETLTNLCMSQNVEYFHLSSTMHG